MKNKWQWIERGIYLISIIIGVLLFLRDEAKDDALIETKLNILIENDEKQETYIERQNEINGKFVILYDYFINSDKPGTD